MKKILIFAITAAVLHLTFLNGTGKAEEPADSSKKERKYFEYKGNYREEIDKLKAGFKAAFGYELMDLNRGWRPDEIRQIHKAFAALPESFHRLPGLKGFYRSSRFSKDQPNQMQGGDIPAATYPRFTTIYRQEFKEYRVEIQDDNFRIEFYDPLFSRDLPELEEIVHHEMAHAFDIAHGYLSFRKEWLQAAGFRVVHLPALDGKQDSDYLFALVNDPNRSDYAPVSMMHLPVYSRENPQEDFANSVSAYLHYPFFQYSNPKRYAFLKASVFPNTPSGDLTGKYRDYADAVQKTAKIALEKGDWKGLFDIAVEVGRNPAHEIEAVLIEILRVAKEKVSASQGGALIGQATCYLFHPEALKIRKAMAREGKLTSDDIMKHERCSRVARMAFEEGQVQWPVLNLYYSRDEGPGRVQFLDPAGLTAYSRGFENHYQWKLRYPEADRPIAQGDVKVDSLPNGSVEIDLGKTARKSFKFPFGEVVQLEVNALRFHPESKARFASPPAVIRFVAQTWFQYEPRDLPDITIRYPLSMLALEKRLAN